MATNIGTLMATVGVDTGPLKKGLNDAEQQTLKSTKGMLSHWKAMATGIVATYAVFKITKFAKETALVHARFETLGVVMKVVGENAGYSATEMDNYDKALRKTGISMIESRQSLSRMAQAQLDLSKATMLGRIAQDAAVIGNINSSEAFQRMIYGIQSGNLLVLKTIGINVSFEQSYKDVAEATNRTTASFTQAEKAIIRQNAVIKYGSRIAGTYEAAMGTAGKKLTSFVRYVDDFKVKMGKAFGPATVMLVDAATMSMKQFQEEISKPEAQETLRNLSTQLAKVIIQLGKDLPQAIESTTNEIAKLNALYNSLPQEVVGTAGAGLIGHALFGSWKAGQFIAALYFINTQMSQLGMGLGNISKDYTEAADAFQKAWEEIIGQRVKGVKFFTIDDENRAINQFKKMEKILAEGKSRLALALEAPAKFYGDRAPEYEMIVALGILIDKQQLKREMQLADEQINILINQRGKYVKEQLAIGKKLADKRLEMEKQFNVQYADMDKTRFQLDIESVEAQAEIWRNAGLNRIRIKEWETHKILELKEAEAKRIEDADKHLNIKLLEGIESWATSFSGMLNDMFWGAETTFADIAKSFGKMITQMLIQEATLKLIGSTEKSTGLLSLFKSARGNIVNNGVILPYAKGGIVNSPTIFPMANGAGLMGEAGAEGILPLKRMSGGDLGVQTEGNKGGQTVNITINAIDSQSFSQAIERNPNAIVQVISDSLEENTGLRQSIRNTI